MPSVIFALFIRLNSQCVLYKLLRFILLLHSTFINVRVKNPHHHVCTKSLTLQFLQLTHVICFGPPYLTCRVIKLLQLPGHFYRFLLNTTLIREMRSQYM
jgi:hypothetical protein